MARKKTTKKKKPKLKRFIKVGNRRIDRKKIKRGKYVPVEAGYVPPFRMSCHFVVDNKHWVLVHGIIHVVPAKWRTLKKAQSVPHAWVECEKMVYDPLLKIYMSRSTFYKLFQVKNVKKYKFYQMKDMLFHKRRYGRWDEILPFER